MKKVKQKISLNEERRSIELQLIDCNCNDCIFLVKDCKKNQKHKDFNSEDGLEYGYCEKKKINVSYIPDICQVETQECFLHRKLVIEKYFD